MLVIQKSLQQSEVSDIVWRNKMERLINKEYKFYIFLSILIIVISGISFAYLFSLVCAVLVCIIELILFIIFIVYTNRRYDEIKQLNVYLMDVYTGGEVMDIRDNEEGELSILKNDLYKVTRTLKEQSLQLQEDKVFLADTLSNISHQLKTPLTSMMLMNDVMLDENLPSDKKQQFMQMTHHQLERMQWLVSSLLTLSKIDANAIIFKEEKINAKELIEMAVESQLIPMEIKHQQLSIECDEHCYIKGDMKWLSEALLNIIKNCVEHAQESGTIKIKCMSTPLFVNLVIQDNGEGISKEDLPHIFERFYKGKQTNKDSVGIGLAMAKALINHNHGKIEVTSDKKHGTTFLIQLQKDSD